MPMEMIVEMVKHNQSTVKREHFVRNYDVKQKKNMKKKQNKKFPAMN